MIQPGNHVDVILTVSESIQASDKDITGGGSSTVLLQNIEVLAVDRQTDTPTDSKSPVQPKSSKDIKDTKSVTLLITPDQSAFLTLGQTKGVLHLSLRHPNDSIVTQGHTATMRQMNSLQAQQNLSPSLITVIQIRVPQKSASHIKKSSVRLISEWFVDNKKTW